jgi:hypothetical protein
MTAPLHTLPDALEHCDMLLIDGLHAFDFGFDDDDTLHIECMDGRELKRWQFSAAELLAASRFNDAEWDVQGAGATHRLTCLSAFSAREDETDSE